MNCPKCGKEYTWGFETPKWCPDHLTLVARCDCGAEGELVEKELEGDELEQHKAYIADYLFWQRANEEQKMEGISKLMKHGAVTRFPSNMPADYLMTGTQFATAMEICRAQKVAEETEKEIKRALYHPEDRLCEYCHQKIEETTTTDKYGDIIIEQTCGCRPFGKPVYSRNSYSKSYEDRIYSDESKDQRFEWHEENVKRVLEREKQRREKSRDEELIRRDLEETKFDSKHYGERGYGSYYSDLVISPEYYGSLCIEVNNEYSFYLDPDIVKDMRDCLNKYLEEHGEE